MKVSDLISIVSEYDGDLEVGFLDETGNSYEVSAVSVWIKQSPVEISSIDLQMAMV
jgi:hypothetical protein